MGCIHRRYRYPVAFHYHLSYGLSDTGIPQCLDWFGLIEWSNCGPKNGPSFTIRIYFLPHRQSNLYRWQLAAWHRGMSFIVIVKTLFLHHHTFGQYLIAYTILALVHMFQLSRVSSSFRLLVWQHVQKQLVWYTKVIVLYITKESYCVHFNDCTLSPH